MRACVAVAAGRATRRVVARTAARVRRHNERLFVNARTLSALRHMQIFIQRGKIVDSFLKRGYAACPQTFFLVVAGVKTSHSGVAD
jgi:predicted nucleic acid-binding Zn finger protein